MKDVIIAGKTIRLTFSMRDWEKMEDEICTVEELDDALKKKGRIRTIYKLTALMAHDDVVTEEWLALNVQPHQMRPLIQQINQAIIKAMTRKENDGAVHDAVLEEIEKKAGGAE